MKKIILLPLFGLLAHSLAAQRPAVASDDVSAQLAQRARELALNAPSLRSAVRETRTVYVNTERIRMKGLNGTEDPRELLRVIHYRYSDDAGLHTVVDLERGEVVDHQEIPHLAVALADAELEQARELAMADERVRIALGDYADRVEVEALVIRAASERDRWFARRVVRLLFRFKKDYLSRPVVVVDLTDSKVYLDGETEG